MSDIERHREGLSYWGGVYMSERVRHVVAGLHCL